MPARKLNKKPLARIDVIVTPLIDEWVARVSFSRNMSKAEFVRSHFPPDEAMKSMINRLRREQKGYTNILRPISK
jgi:hypothetical protein